ncbi:MAG: hypothetical protein LAQ69_35215 [Acidobacteriia bacterium]|nr:hypothetical protein [Terriglobia bacterium]
MRPIIAILALAFCSVSLGQTGLRARLEFQLGHTETITATAFSPDGKLAVTAGNGLVTLWDLETGRQIYQLHGGWAGVSNLAFPDEDTLLVTAKDSGGSESRFQLKTGHPIEGTVHPLNSCGDGSVVFTTFVRARYSQPSRCTPSTVTASRAKPAVIRQQG